jgi:hypothetical protein
MGDVKLMAELRCVCDEMKNRKFVYISEVRQGTTNLDAGATLCIELVTELVPELVSS